MGGRGVEQYCEIRKVGDLSVLLRLSPFSVLLPAKSNKWQF